MSLKSLLKERNISMYRLAKLSGVSKTVIIDICSGKSALENCTAKNVCCIANALNLTTEELLQKCSDIVLNDNSITSVVNSVNYITGIHALNIPCSLDTSGDWHSSALHWDKLTIKNSCASVWGSYGIEISENVPENPGRHFVANHIRACLDLIEEGRFSLAQSMRKDYICTNKYDKEIFFQISKLKNTSTWENVRSFMKREYRSAWLDYERNVLYV